MGEEMRRARSARQWRGFLILAIALHGCSRAAVTTTSLRAPVSIRDTTLDYLNRPPGNDSLAVIHGQGVERIGARCHSASGITRCTIGIRRSRP